MFEVGCWKKRGPSATVGMTECEITKREEKRGPSTAVGMSECGITKRRERRGPSTSVGMTERGKRREVPPLRASKRR